MPDLGEIWDVGKQLFTADFWGRIFTRPLEAVRQMPEVAAKSALYAGAATAAIGTGIKVVPVAIRALGALFGAARVATPAVSFAVRHPIATYVAVQNADLPTQIVQAFASRPQIVVAPAPSLPGVQGPPPEPPRTAVTLPPTPRGFLTQPGAVPVQALFGW